MDLPDKKLKNAAVKKREDAIVIAGREVQLYGRCFRSNDVEIEEILDVISINCQ